VRAPVSMLVITLVMSLAAILPAADDGSTAPIPRSKPAAVPDWENPAVFAVNREAPHCTLTPCDSLEDALTGDPAASSPPSSRRRSGGTSGSTGGCSA